MIYYRKLFRIPGPKDLGMSDNNNAMASEMFRNNDTENTWEMYYARIKQHYPVRYFFASSLPGFFDHAWSRLSKPFENAYWWMRYHFHPSDRYHVLKLSQPKSDISDVDEYSVGWIDSDRQLLFAAFNILNRFVEKEMPYGYYLPSEEEAAKDDGIDNQYMGLKRQREKTLEIQALYHWWNVDRKTDAKHRDELLTTYANMRRPTNTLGAKLLRGKSPDVEQAWQELQAAEKAFDDKEDEMLARLLAARRSMWT